MVNDDEKYDLIEQYLAGELSGTALSDFENQLGMDIALREELDLHRQVTETLKGEKVHQLREVIKKVDKQWQIPKTKKKTNFFSLPFRSIAAIAAAILTLFIAYQVYSPKTLSKEALFAANYEPYKMILNQRSIPTETSETDKLLNEAVTAYGRKDYKEASNIFQTLEKEKPNAPAFRFYTALSELSLGNSDQATTILEAIVKEAPPLFIEQSRWYLALAYLQNEDIQNAKSQLLQIPSDAFKYAEAQALLKAL